MLLTAIGCIGLGVSLLIRSFTDTSSLFMSTTQTLQESDDFYQHLALIATGVGFAILVFLRKYWK